MVIVGIANRIGGRKRSLFSTTGDGSVMVRKTGNVNPYLVPTPNVFVQPTPSPSGKLAEMRFGNMPNDGGHLLMNTAEAENAIKYDNVDSRFIRTYIGSQEFISGLERRCVWVRDGEYGASRKSDWLRARFERVRKHRLKSNRSTTRALAEIPFRFGEVRQTGEEIAIVVPRVSSENREYLPVGLVSAGTIIGDRNFALYDAPLWNLGLIASKLHYIWIATVCGRLEMRLSYSNTLGWNTFPVPTLTRQNKADLAQCAETILLAREAHFPATIAELYDPARMPANLKAAHERNDEVLERIYIGRRFRNDTERLEKLFEMYATMTEGGS